jgi:ribokinase
MAARVFVFGSINTDLVVYVSHLPQPGETIGGGTYRSFPGGKGANQAVAAARAGAVVQLYGCLGDDAFGRERLASLEQTGVSTRGVRVLPDVASGVAEITVDAAGENTIVVAPGANDRFAPEGVEIPSPSPGEIFVSLFQNEVPQESTEALILRARAAGHRVFWNLAPTLSRRPIAEALRAVECLICNRNELADLAGRPRSASDDPAGMQEDSRVPLAWGVNSLIVTLGRRGSMLITAEETQAVSAFPVEAVDTVGAGDCYCGVLAASVAQGLPMTQAMRRASAAAALSTTRRGAQPSMPTREEINAFLSRPQEA